MRMLVGPDDVVGDAAELSDDDLRRLYAPPHSPWLRVNMVSTVDGSATGTSGRSGSINNEPDNRVFHLLRELADVIVVGAGTARTEGYAPTDRPTVVVSRRGDVPEGLRGAEPGSVLLATCSSAEGLAEARELLGADQVLELGSHRVDLGGLRTTLAERGHSHVLCEGGPHLLHDLLEVGAADELTATFVPLLVAGDFPRIAQGAPLDVPLDLTLLLEEGGTLLGRWAVAGTDPATSTRGV